MENIERIVKLLQNSGVRVIGADAQFIAIEDPSCILRGFDTFLQYAWIAVIFVTMLLLSGWAVSMLRGAKNDIFTNLRALILIFGTLGAVGPILTVIWGRDFISQGCKTVKVSIAETQKLLDLRNSKLKTRTEDDIWEELDIFDSGAPANTTYNEQPDTPVTDVPSVEPYGDNGGAGDTGGTGDNGGNGGNTTYDADPNTPTAAQIDNRDVIYIYPNNNKIRRSGGTPAWRNNNPGNIVYSSFSRNAGALINNGRFSVFPTEGIGMSAIKKLLRSASYNNLTIAGAISRWAPPHENNTAKYQQDLARMTGLDIQRSVSSLSDAELDRVAQAIRKIEGVKPGRETRE